MICAYVITEGQTDINILQKLLPENLTESLYFIAGSGKYGAQSLAATILAVKLLPVALVINADTEDELAVREQSTLLHQFLYQSSPGIPFLVFLAVPELEIVLLTDRSIIETIAQRQLTDAEWQFSRSHPKEFLNTITTTAELPTTQSILNHLTPEEKSILQQHPLITDLINFLRNFSSTQQPVKMN